MRTMLDDVERWEEERKGWVSAIGNFILSCGEIEARSFDILEDLLSDEIPGYVRSMKWEQRRQLILALANTEKLENRHDLLGELTDLLKRAEKVMAVRNVIAHNPLVLKIIGEGRDMDTEQVVRRYYDSDSEQEKSEYTISKLLVALTDAQMVESELGDCAVSINLHLNPGA